MTANLLINLGLFKVNKITINLDWFKVNKITLLKVNKMILTCSKPENLPSVKNSHSRSSHLCIV